MPKPLERLGRVKDPKLGACVKVAYYTWGNCGCPGDDLHGHVMPNDHRNGCDGYVRHEELFPVDQSRPDHPRHPSGFDPVTHKSVSVISPSCSFYGELCRYGQFNWDKKSKYLTGEQP